jgi:SAM-dependent methyltransferase
MVLKSMAVYKVSTPYSESKVVVTLSDIIRCPRCRARLDRLENRLICTDTGCHYSNEGFQFSDDQPVLIDFERSVFDRPRANAVSSVLRRDDMRTSLRNRVMDFFEGSNQIGVANSRAVLRELKSLSKEPALLIIGGGGLGAGVETFLQDASVQVIATDVYASANTQVVADAHHLPFDDGVFDGVWITAVLEHVLEPQTVVNEIWRVLKPAGLVYAETPFMQPVHGNAYDFTRFTACGHRWLFRRFEQIDAGASAGAGHALAWSVRYFVRAFLGSKIATFVALPFFGLRLCDNFADARRTADAAMGLYLFGRKSDRSLAPKDMVPYYESQRAWTKGRRI